MADQATQPDAPTALVIAYRKPDSLDRLLASLTGPVCVVNVSADPDVAAVAQRHGAGLVSLPDNRGFAAAVNAGARSVSTPVTVVMNDDVMTSQADLNALAAAVRGGADVAGPALLDGQGRLQRSIIGPPTVWGVACTVLLPDHPVPGLRWLPVPKWSLPREAAVVPALTGAIFAVRTDLLKSIPMPEHYFLYWEEVEWFWHLGQTGARVEYRPDIQATHEGGRDDVRPEKAGLLALNAVRCVRRTQGRMAAAAVWPLVAMSALRLLLVDAVRLGRGRVDRGRVGARWAGLRSAVLAAWEIR